MRSEGSVCREPSLRERGSGSHTPCPPKSSPVSIRCSFLLGFGVIFGRSFGHVFFHQAPTERGRKAEPPVLQPLPLTPGRRHPRVSPQLLCISLLHLRPLFHELHVSVQQVQTPLRVPLEYLKLILAGRLGGPRSGPGDPTAADPAAREPPGSELQEGVASRPRPGAARGEAGNRREPPPLPGKGQKTGAGPQPDYRVPSPGAQEGCGMGQGHSPCPRSPSPPRFRKLRPAWPESGPEGQGSLQLGGAPEWSERGHQVPPVATLPRVPPGGLSFPY